ncbi:MAG: oligopeptidase A, partial [Gammaproteobacteria bacterium]|nr:oligopeptidase A [Gammaproteobacteria bacterium]
MKSTAVVDLPMFSTIDPQEIVPQVKAFIKAANRTIANVCRSTKPSWKTVLQPLQDLVAQEAVLWAPIRHLNNVASTPELRTAHDEALSLWTEYHNALGQNEALYKIIAKIKDSAEFESLTSAQKMVITHELRDFHLSGVDLSIDKKERYRAISEQLTALCANFGANVLDATKAYTRTIHHEEELSGLPLWLIEEAKEKKQSHPILTLSTPVYSAVMQFADHRPLREDMYVAY